MISDKGKLMKKVKTSDPEQSPDAEDSLTIPLHEPTSNLFNKVNIVEPS
jgi:hypothetical protein